MAFKKVKPSDPWAATINKPKAAQRNKRQVKEDDVRKILADAFTAYHLRAGCELNVTTNDLWELAEQDWLDGADKPPLRMYKDRYTYQPNTYLWYTARAPHLDEVVEELMARDALRRLGDL